MRRRDFALIVCAVTMAPHALFAQTTTRPPVVGSLWLNTKDAPLLLGYRGQFLAGMRELGYVEGQNLEMLDRFADYQADRLPQLATELVQLKPDVIFAPSNIDAVPLKKATDTIPIVVGALADPIEQGLVKSYARPGGNLTGVMPYVAGLAMTPDRHSANTYPRSARVRRKH
jgi:putative tryptophan/tyrosine transport system substrate-binding protein